METTLQAYQKQAQRCRSLFLAKLQDYGTAWRILRLPSLTDQLYIKALRIRTLEDTGIAKVAEGIEGEYIALVNYSLIALIQLELPADAPLELPPAQATQLYDRFALETQNLMLAKNHDYGEAWRNMRRSSLTDLILTKILRIKQIEDNQGLTKVSEGVAANYQDIINYALFALIKSQT
jgi:hypothetical protein